MKHKPPPPPVDLSRFQREGQVNQNRLLLAWLEDDRTRAQLFAAIRDTGGEMPFPSHAVNRPEEALDVGDDPVPPQTGHKPVRLIVDTEQVRQVLLNADGRWSNRVYAQLGGGSFMLALDPSLSSAHAEQRAAFRAAFPAEAAQLARLAHAATQSAIVTSLRAPVVDLAAFAEQAGLRMGLMLMGYALKDHPVVQDALRLAYGGLVHQVMARHFVVDPTAVPAARQAMARLQRRTAELIDGYARRDPDVLKGCDDPALPDGLTPVLQALATLRGELNVEQRATIALGALVGTVGNVQAAACLAVKALFDTQRPDRAAPALDRWSQARALALAEPLEEPTRRVDDWHALLRPLLRAHPPIPFLPRWDTQANGGKGQEVLLALGGATTGTDDTDLADALVWGLPTGAAHWCAGMALAWPLIIEIVRQTMALPGLDQLLDPTTGQPEGLTQRWGFICERYPLVQQRDRRWAQSSLNVAMRLKPPVRDSADRVRRIIMAGAPRIESALRHSRHVHFAWFELIESDSVLVLHTVYDGPFTAYIEHFALRVGVLFDALFECIEDPPPMPVNDFPNEFVAHIQRYNRPPVCHYFFSAYPRAEVAQILRLRDDLAWPPREDRP